MRSKNRIASCPRAKSWRRALSSAIAAFALSTAHAEEAREAEKAPAPLAQEETLAGSQDELDPASDTVVRLPELVVEGRADSLIGAAEAASEGAVGASEIESRPIQRAGEVLETVPGVIVTQHSGGGKANQYFLRGFNLDHGTDLAVAVARTPVNLPSHGHGQGYTDLNFLIPELIETIRFRKGPYYADEGDFSSAGAVDIEYVDTLPYNLLQLEMGSWAYGRGLVAGSPRLGTGNLLHAFEVQYTNGPWDPPDNYTKLNGLLRYSLGDAESGLELTAMGYHGNWNGTDQIAKRALAQPGFGEFDSLDTSTGGHTQRYSLTGTWNSLESEVASEITGYAFYYDLALFSNFTYFLDDPIDGDQFKQSDRRWVVGLDGSHTLDGSLFGRTLQGTAGYHVRNDSIDNGLFDTVKRSRLATTRADDIVQTAAAVYFRLDTQWLEKFRSEAGVRGDFYYFDVQSDLAANSGDDTDFIASPKLSLIFGPWAQTEVYLNGGYGFHSNDARGVVSTVDPVTGDPVDPADPLVQTKGAEIGVRTVRIPNLQSTLALWLLDIDSELLFIGDAGTTEASRPSRRYGLEFANFYTPWTWLSLDADLSLSHSRFRDSDPAGSHIPGSIETAFAGGLFVHDLDSALGAALEGWSGSLRVRYFGPRALVENDQVRSSSSTLVNSEIGYDINETWSISGEVFNLLNANENDIEYYYTSRLPGEPAEGVDDRHIHVADPISGRLVVKMRF